MRTWLAIESKRTVRDDMPTAYHVSQRKSLNDKDGQGLAELAAPSSRRENPRWSKWNIVKGRDNPSDYKN